MPDPINTALSGLNSSRLRSATRANNLANLNTPGYKAQRAESATGPRGDSVRISAVGRNQSQGSLQPTGNPMDVAINGPGFFQVQDAAGNTFYTRAGAFQQDAAGNLVTSNGLALAPGAAVPPGSQVSFGSDGTISAQTGNAPAAPIGQMQLANFSNPEGLTLVGDNLAAATPASGPPTMGAPGAGGLGTLIPGFLESSNVDLTGEIVDQIVEVNVNAANAAMIRTADEMNRETIDLIG
ncbi:MAG: flagellar hook basal-body protein [bacterium]